MKSAKIYSDNMECFFFSIHIENCILNSSNGKKESKMYTLISLKRVWRMYMCAVLCAKSLYTRKQRTKIACFLLLLLLFWVIFFLCYGMDLSRPAYTSQVQQKHGTTIKTNGLTKSIMQINLSACAHMHMRSALFFLYLSKYVFFVCIVSLHHLRCRLLLLFNLRNQHSLLWWTCTFQCTFSNNLPSAVDSFFVDMFVCSGSFS